MACSQILNGFTALDCDPSKGGVKNIYISNWDRVQPGFSHSTADTSVVEMVTGFTFYDAAYDAPSANTTTASTFHKYTMRRNTASMTSTLNTDETVGVSYVASECVVHFNKLDTPQRLEMTALSLAETMVVVEDANGKFWLMGYDEPCVASAGSAQTGVQKSDGSYYELTIQSSDRTFPIQLSDAAINAVKNGNTGA